ncbi:MAG: hypothetical protein IJH93_01730 [Lachnospiraceae bacterium]|nr:hypothetical protein [Sarcina sp.]MBQ6590253.1 hypothetical protein [Lachnospiraceae bacterium]
MKNKKSERRRRLPRVENIDIGMIIFFIILVYILLSVFMYVTSRKTELYEVRMGTLSDNRVYRGIALRQESLVRSKYTGTVNYYNRECDRIKVGGLAYSVDEKGEIADYADADMLAMDYFSRADLDQFRGQVISFVSDFDPARFYTVYDFKSASSSQAQKISNRAILAGIKDLKSTTLHAVAARDTGSIVYSYDNYNGKTFEKLTAEDFDSSSCKKVQLKNGQKIREGKPAYRIVTDENWSIAIKVDSQETASQLLEEEYVEVRFLKNGFQSWASVGSKEDGDGNYFVSLTFSNSMEAFCMDRFIDIEILSNQKKGLKVPASSITEGEFFLVPKDYVIEGTNGQTGVLVRFYKDAGDAASSGTRFVASVPYSETEDYYYLDNSVLKEGMILEKQDSQDQYTLSRKEKLIGVYYINKGYPDFRQVNVNMQDKEYAIVEPNELYGLQEYDYIVLHADSVHFNNYQ